MRDGFCYQCKNQMFLANTQGTHLECKHCRYITDISQVPKSLGHHQAPPFSGYAEDLLGQPITKRYEWKNEQLNVLRKCGKYYPYSENNPDREIKDLFWSTIANIETGEIFVQAKFKDNEWSDSFFTPVYWPHIRDRVFGIDISDQQCINHLSEIMFDNIKDELK